MLQQCKNKYQSYIAQLHENSHLAFSSGICYYYKIPTLSIARTSADGCRWKYNFEKMFLEIFVEDSCRFK